jgi:hypothetical protein
MFKDGQWWAFRREDDKYIPVPWEKVERNRDSPDGRSHLRDSSASPLPGHHLLQIWQVGGGPSAPLMMRVARSAIEAITATAVGHPRSPSLLGC